MNDEVAFTLLRALDEKSREKASRLLGSVVEELRKIGLSISAETAEELIQEVNKRSKLHNLQWLVQRIDGLDSLVNKELKEKLFLYITPDRQRFLPTVGSPHPFGDEVAQAFPSANFEISEAGWCLALARASASVFHLMRTLEIGLTALGSVFGISLANTNWEPAIREIESKIREMHKDPHWRAMADCKRKQESYAQAASHFGILKDAWRNYTMHARGSYSEDDAQMIFMSVKKFMQKLAALGLGE
ncbi:MAG TPA: hypothetical protein VMD58_10240 [Acidobacteriaceae bacterium]|nr:hypothetical protein [Acidobacteriaceae bacterium]